jgi:hypothetical protein
LYHFEGSINLQVGNHCHRQIWFFSFCHFWVTPTLASGLQGSLEVMQRCLCTLQSTT